MSDDDKPSNPEQPEPSQPAPPAEETPFERPSLEPVEKGLEKSGEQRGE
jgi:hypothetical protein